MPAPEIDPAEVARCMVQGQAQLDSGQPEEAVRTLRDLPEDLSIAPEQQLALCLLRQGAYLGCAERPGCAPGLQLAFFFRAQKAFFRAVYVNPLFHEAYLVQAAFWRLLGRPGMATRLLRSIQMAAPTPAVAEALQAHDSHEASVPGPHIVPSWTPKKTPRILVLTIPGYDPAIDVLFDGLCTVLGEGQVIEYPYKPLLHGGDAAEADNYPTTFNHPASPRELEWLCARLREGYFDFILYGDMLQTIPREALRQLLQAAGETPVYIVDGWDDASDNQGIILEALGRSSVPLYFKREMIACVDYGSNAVPLPLAYPDDRVPKPLPTARTNALFWAGNRYYGLRRLYLEHFEAALGTSLSTNYTQEEYAQALDTAHIGLSLCGFGFDTVRYWEVPAHGALLLAEHPPILIPNDFTDMKSAVFFDDLPGLFERFRHLSQHPEAIPKIAAAGHRHFLAHHTASARARQLLAHLEAHRRGV